MTDKKYSIAVIGGTGALGFGLALRWAKAGHEIVIGSRAQESADRGAERLAALAPEATVSGLENSAAAQAAEIVVLTVPFSNQAPMLEAIKPGCQGKIMVDVTVPLQPPKVRTVHLPEHGSAGKGAQVFLGDGVRVVSAFQNVAADHLTDLEHEIDCDILVCGNDPEARQIVVGLAEDASMRAWHAGRIENSVVSEALTSALIFMNNRYKIAGAGIRISGAPGSAESGDH
ncbi:MAG: NADPH-dependent F420 reductase [Rhodospirillaceae bacterium]|jgi:8-hydroxy-5-deazaflavin:NADPH oxidoreductase|nr:NADPH-dependent F420 reductase [Rhodospirillaceae bacterium]MBT5195781.1 NADPH-dependent F420 reductase [Rhodospirillaceae bacterium]MBT5898201.1 NADPH-dependent F420 reductase [Rhodospirillaceae bacterium]